MGRVMRLCCFDLLWLLTLSLSSFTSVSRSLSPANDVPWEYTDDFSPSLSLSTADDALSSCSLNDWRPADALRPPLPPLVDFLRPRPRVLIVILPSIVLRGDLSE